MGTAVGTAGGAPHAKVKASGGGLPAPLSWEIVTQRPLDNVQSWVSCAAPRRACWLDGHALPDTPLLARVFLGLTRVA